MPDGTFGTWLRERRQELDLTRAELARLAGCARITLQKLETGERRPSRPMAERLARCLQVPGDLLGEVVEAARRGTAPRSAALGPAPEAAAGSIPLPLTPLIGREAELAAVGGLLRHSRLVTLTGTAGVGKTRLALFLGRSLAGAFRDGAVFVSLEHATEPEQLLPALARALELEDSSLPALVEALHNKRMLLLLDNFEQIVAAAASLAGLLSACPLLVALVTSREALNVRGERPYALEPLAVPAPGAGVRAVLDAPAVRLFAAVASTAAPAWHIDAAAAPTVAAICRRLDGLPLAIELVASGVRRFPPPALLEQMEAALHLGTLGPRDLPDRQRTLRAALDWSYGLLDPDAARCLDCLGVFVDGAEAEQLAVVVGSDATQSAVAAALADLAAKSLVQPVAGTEGRYRLLDVTRLYALERLATGGALDDTRRSHARAYASLAERARPQLDGPEQQHWLARLDRDYANLLAALDWYERSDLEAAAELAVVLFRFWFMRGYVRDGQRRLSRILERGGELPPELRARALNAGGALANALGDAEAGAALLQQSLALYRALDDAAGISNALYNLGATYLQLSRYDEAQACLEQGLAHDRARGSTWDVALTLGSLANLLVARERYAEARPPMEESLALLRELGDDHSVALTLCNLAEIDAGLGDYRAARGHSDAALALARAQQYRRVLLYALIQAAGIALHEQDTRRAAACCAEAVPLLEQASDASASTGLLYVLARLAAQRERFEQAATLLAAFDRLREAHHITLSQLEQTELETYRATVRAALDEPSYSAAQQRGSLLAFEDAVAMGGAISDE